MKKLLLTALFVLIGISSISAQFIQGGQENPKQGSVRNVVPQEYMLGANYPNPFNSTTTITYGLPIVSDVTIDIFNLIGQKVAAFTKQGQEPGTYEMSWNADDFNSGVFFYTMTARSIDGTKQFRQTKKMTYLK